MKKIFSFQISTRTGDTVSTSYSAITDTYKSILRSIDKFWVFEIRKKTHSQSHFSWSPLSRYFPIFEVYSPCHEKVWSQPPCHADPWPMSRWRVTVYIIMYIWHGNAHVWSCTLWWHCKRATRDPSPAEFEHRSSMHTRNRQNCDKIDKIQRPALAFRACCSEPFFHPRVLIIAQAQSTGNQ